MTKIFCIHPSVCDVESFLTFTCLEGAVDASSLVWDAAAPDILFATEWTFYRKDLFESFSKLYGAARIKVAWMGEAVAADMNVFDYAVGFDAGRESDTRFIRLPSPLDMFHRFASGRENGIKNIDEARELLAGKDGFCNFLYSNPNAHPMRDKLFYALGEYKKVDSLGKHLNNTGLGGTGYGGHYADCTTLKSSYRFSIASENAEYEGYTTEKILTSLAAHTVPIYWGNPLIDQDVNPKCFINARDFASLDELVKHVAKVDSDPELWSSMVAEPWFTPEQETSHLKRTESYISKMKSLLSGEAPKRAPEGYHVSLYRKQFFKDGFAFKKKILGIF